MKIPFFDIDRIYQANSTEILGAVGNVFKTGNVLMGPDVAEFENKIGSYCNRRFAVAVGSCTDALYFALLATGIKPGDEVLVTSFSFIASVSPILRAGAIPVFTDIDPSTYMMDPADLERKISPRTKAIVAVHLFGQTLPIDRIEEISSGYQLALIEDAAQSIGAHDNGRMAGSMGHASCMSFDPTKVIGAFGNGGVLLTDDAEIASRVRKYHYHGKNMDTGEFEILGFNSRLASSQAALLTLQLDWLPGWIAERARVAGIYMDDLRSLPDITLPVTRPGSNHVYHKFVIRAGKERDRLMAHLGKNGIKTMIHYSNALFENPLFRDFPYKAESLANVHKATQEVLSLPVYPYMTDEEAHFVTTTIQKYYKQ